MTVLGKSFQTPVTKADLQKTIIYFEKRFVKVFALLFNPYYCFKYRKTASFRSKALILLTSKIMIIRPF
jgi:hypothetical protein